MTVGWTDGINQSAGVRRRLEGGNEKRDTGRSARVVRGSRHTGFEEVVPR